MFVCFSLISHTLSLSSSLFHPHIDTQIHSYTFPCFVCVCVCVRACVQACVCVCVCEICFSQHVEKYLLMYVNA